MFIDRNCLFCPVCYPFLGTCLIYYILWNLSCFGGSLIGGWNSLRSALFASASSIFSTQLFLLLGEGLDILVLPLLSFPSWLKDRMSVISLSASTFFLEINYLKDSALLSYFSSGVIMLVLADSLDMLSRSCSRCASISILRPDPLSRQFL